MDEKELLDILFDNKATNLSFLKSVLKTNYEIIGVKIPFLKKISSKLMDFDFNKIEIKKYYELIFLYFYVNLKKNINDISKQILFIKENIKYIDSWSIVDSTVLLLKNINLDIIYKMLQEKEVYLRRYAYVSLLKYSKNENNLNFIFNSFDNDNRYYVFMSEARLLSYCFIYFFDKTYDFVMSSSLSKELKLKGIQKAIESLRVTETNKDKLKILRKELRSRGF